MGRDAAIGAARGAGDTKRRALLTTPLSTADPLPQSAVASVTAIDHERMRPCYQCARCRVSLGSWLFQWYLEQSDQVTLDLPHEGSISPHLRRPKTALMSVLKTVLKLKSCCLGFDRLTV